MKNISSLPESEPEVPTTGPSIEPAEMPEASSTGESVVRASAGIGAVHLLRFLIGFAAQPLIAHNFGLNWRADVYTVATDITQRFWLVFEKVINPAFLPNFIALMKDDGEEKAWDLASTALWMTLISLLILTPIAYFAMPMLVRALSQKPHEGQIELTIHFARILLLGLCFLSVSSLTYTILNGYKRFFYAALGDVFWKVGVLAGALAAMVTHASVDKALTLIVYGFLAGSILKLAPHVFAIGKKWKHLKPRIDLKDPMVRKMASIAVPLLVGIVISESRGFYLAYLADDPSVKVEASRAAIKWSRTIGDNLIQVFPYALSIGIFPFLADLAREKNRQPLTDMLMSALRICVFVFVPITAILIALRYPLLRAVWESGRMSQDDTRALSGPYVAYNLGLLAFACEMMLNQTYYAMTRAWTPTLTGLATTGLWIAIATFGVQYAHWGLAAILGAEAFSKTVKCLVMWLMLKPQLGDVKARENAAFFVRVLVGAIIAAVFAYVASMLIFPHGSSPSKVRMLGTVAICGVGGFGVFLGVGAAMKLDEMRYLKKISKRLRRA